MTILAGATPLQLRNGTVALVVGAVLYGIAVLPQRRTPRTTKGQTGDQEIRRK